MDLNQEIKLSELFKRRSRPRKSASVKPAATKKKPKKQEIIGLKIGASQIAASRVVNNGGSRPKLVQLARQPLERGVVVRGEVRDVIALSRALDKLFADNKLPRRGIRLGIGTNRIGVRALDVEGIEDERQLENAIRFRAHEALSIPMEQAVLDYHVVNETVDEAGAVSRRVILAAAYREPIDLFVEACRNARIELSAIDVEAFALLRAVAPSNQSLEQQDAAVVGVALGYDRSTLAISDGSVCDFMRVLEWGGSRLDAAISRALGLTLEEAEAAKLELSLEGEQDETDLQVVRARDAVRAELQTLARELVASLQFYQSQPGSLAISEVLLTGGTTRLPGLIEELERLVRVPVRVPDLLAGVHADAAARDRGDLASLAVAIGLGVEA